MRNIILMAYSIVLVSAHSFLLDGEFFAMQSVLMGKLLRNRERRRSRN